MKGTILIGLGFRARSGKDTAAAEIKKQRGNEYKLEIIPFAKALKQEVNELASAAGGMKNLFTPNRNFVLADGYYIDFPAWVQYDPEAPTDDPYCPLGKQRSLLQFYGTEVRRAQDKNYWIKKHTEAVAESTADIVLVPDLRFTNEMVYILKYGEAVRVDRAGLPPATHITETALEDSTDWSILLDNNGTLEEFKEGAVTCFDELLTHFPVLQG